MKKYNLSNIMKRAWTIFKISARRAAIKFAEALKESWAIEKGIVEDAEKEEAEKANGIVEMHYAEYKKNYAGCKTVAGSYNKATKTIKVCTREFKRIMGLCPRCHTYCYGDCTAR